jgi:hypothetical protein
MRGDDRPRPHGNTREERELRERLLRRKISKVTYDKEFAKLKELGLIQRNGKVIR